MCLGVWSLLGFVTDADVKGVVSILPELHEEEDQEEFDAEFRGFF